MYTKEQKKNLYKAYLQAGAAYKYAEFKARRQFKRERSEKTPYKPGSIGLSVISSAIKKEYGRILSRKERKSLAKAFGKPFKAFYA
ncbi:hypothetical protein ACM1RC_27500 [Paenibacillus azoreducens]|uniref:hypothetical protein n=1 Tax=Paenibacillus azoreducens TaxID=116718 RepID=UPI0039F4A627